MKLISLTIKDKIVFKDQLSCCIGHFDGFHLGHRKLVEEAIIFAKKNNCKSAIITFDINPINLDEVKVRNLLKLENKIEMARNLKVDYLIVLEFNQDLQKTSTILFNKFLNDNFKILNMVCGFDFKYGYLGKGDFKDLKLAFANVKVVDSVNYDGEKISSTRIRALLKDGQIELANQILGYDYFIEGIVIHGLKIGKAMGFPTANIRLEEAVFNLKKGVYKAYTIIDNHKYLALVNIGNNPTIDINNEIKIEAHILNFNQQIYAKNVRFHLTAFIREEIKFNSKKQLAKQIKKDIDGVLYE